MHGIRNKLSWEYHAAFLCILAAAYVLWPTPPISREDAYRKCAAQARAMHTELMDQRRFTIEAQEVNARRGQRAFDLKVLKHGQPYAEASCRTNRTNRGEPHEPLVWNWKSTQP